MTATSRTDAQKVLQALSPHAQKQYRDAWAALEPRLIALAGKGAKVFEVHHLIEAARSVYFAGLASHYDANTCVENVITQFGLNNPIGEA